MIAVKGTTAVLERFSYRFQLNVNINAYNFFGSQFNDSVIEKLMLTVENLDGNLSDRRRTRRRSVHELSRAILNCSASLPVVFGIICNGAASVLTVCIWSTLRLLNILCTLGRWTKQTKKQSIRSLQLWTGRCLGNHGRTKISDAFFCIRFSRPTRHPIFTGRLISLRYQSVPAGCPSVSPSCMLNSSLASPDTHPVPPFSHHSVSFQVSRDRPTFEIPFVVREISPEVNKTPDAGNKTRVAARQWRTTEEVSRDRYSEMRI